MGPLDAVIAGVSSEHAKSQSAGLATPPFAIADLPLIRIAQQAPVPLSQHP
jgi:hypothetical protein